MTIPIPWDGVVDQITAFMTSDVIVNGVSWMIGLAIGGLAIRILRSALS